MQGESGKLLCCHVTISLRMSYTHMVWRVSETMWVAVPHETLPIRFNTHWWLWANFSYSDLGHRLTHLNLINKKLFKKWVLSFWAGHVPQMSPSTWLEGLENLAVLPLFKGPGPFSYLGIPRRVFLSHLWKAGVRPASSLKSSEASAVGLDMEGKEGTTTGPPFWGFFANTVNHTVS